MRSRLAQMTLAEGEDPFAVAHLLVEELQTTLDHVSSLDPNQFLNLDGYIEGRL